MNILARQTAVSALVLTSALSVSGQTMYWTSDSGQTIHRGPATGGPVEDLVVDNLQPVGLALDLAAGKMYWAQRTGGICRSNLDGSAVEIIVPSDGSMAPRGVALDSTAGKLYWVCDSDKRIQRCDLDGSDVETVLEAPPIAQLLGISIDAVGGKLYWVDTANSTISRADLDGANAEVIVSAGTFQPYYMDLDLNAGHIYWTDYYQGNILRANLDGSEAAVLIDIFPNQPVGIALDLPAGKVYWTLLSGAIQRANLDGTAIEDVVTGLPTAWAVELDLRSENVPTLSQWGLGVMALLLLVAAGLALRRQGVSAPGPTG